VVATLEIEGAERGWLASVGLDPAGELQVRESVTADVQPPLQALLRRLLEEPFEGQLVGARRGEDLLYALADIFGRRRPLLGAERVFGYVQGGSRVPRDTPPIPGWDEP
jgi:hypothetical protein